MGEFKWTAGEYFADAADKGIKASEDARHYAISAKLDSPLTNRGTDLVLQYSVKLEQELDCGGAYIKLMGETDQLKFGGDSPYQIMFGPDICGPSNKKTHVIVNYPPKKDNLLIKEEVKVESDKLSHLYTLHIKADNSFEVYIDQQSVRSGKLEEAFDFLVAKEIKDPSQSKPKDWVDEVKIADPEATMPEDWDSEEDGTWEAPLVDNPEFKGNWKAKMIDNPAYVGPWTHPMIANPDYIEDTELHVRCTDCTHIGFELWMVKSGTIFDDIIVTDSLEEAKAYADATYEKKKGAEKAAYEAIEEAKSASSSSAADSSDSAAKIDDEDEEEEGNDEL
jgi:calreticulin